MNHQTVEQAIQSIKNGNIEEGSRLLKIVIKDPETPNHLRAIGLVHLATTKPDRNFQIRCYEQALESDPTNTIARERLDQFLKVSVPKTMENRKPNGQVIQLNNAPHVLGLVDAINGKGSAILIDKEGIVCTCYQLIKNMETVTVSLDDGRSLKGKIIRSFPYLDLAFIRIPLSVNQLWPSLPKQVMRPNTDIGVYPFMQEAENTRVRATQNLTQDYWFPTQIVEGKHLQGAAVFANQVLVGMMTGNASRASHYFYGLYIWQIYYLLEQYKQELAQLPDNAIYCVACGNNCRSVSYGGYYCEHCGTTLSIAEDVVRNQRPELAYLYGENTYAPCPQCGSTAGEYAGLCLRCGAEV
ncbi:hypothetical protein MASR2M15_28250 [Anaerolineales bacterium]